MKTTRAGCTVPRAHPRSRRGYRSIAKCFGRRRDHRQLLESPCCRAVVVPGTWSFPKLMAPLQAGGCCGTEAQYLKVYITPPHQLTPKLPCASLYVQHPTLHSCHLILPYLSLFPHPKPPCKPSSPDLVNLQTPCSFMVLRFFHSSMESWEAPSPTLAVNTASACPWTPRDPAVTRPQARRTSSSLDHSVASG